MCLLSVIRTHYFNMAFVWQALDVSIRRKKGKSKKKCKTFFWLVQLQRTGKIACCVGNDSRFVSVVFCFGSYKNVVLKVISRFATQFMFAFVYVWSKNSHNTFLFCIFDLQHRRFRFVDNSPLIILLCRKTFLLCVIC